MSQVEDTGTRAVAIVGLGALAPGADDTKELWELLCGNESRFTGPLRFPGAPLQSPEVEDRAFSVISAYVGEFTPHPTLAAEIQRGEWEQVNSEVLWLRNVLLQAMDDVTPRPGQRAGCYVAAWTGGTLLAEDSVLVSYLAQRLSRRLADDEETQAGREQQLRELLRKHHPYAGAQPWLTMPDGVVRGATAGLLPNDTDWLTVNAACASGLFAMDIGMSSLLAGDCDVAYCGAVHGVGRLMTVASTMLEGGRSRRNEVRSLDVAADGTMMSEAATMVVLKRYDQALADGDEAFAVLNSSAMSADGRGKTVITPNPAGLRRAITRAWREAGVTADDLSWILAHATGNTVADQLEVDSYQYLAGERDLWCSSNKSLLGHASMAAGGLSVIHAVQALTHERIPAQAKFTTPNAALRDGKIHVPTQPVDWPKGDRPRVVGISGIGLGGSNSHLIVSDRITKAPPPRPPAGPGEPLVLTAWSAWLPGALEPERVREWLATGENPPEHGFGEQYPAPSFAASKLPPAVLGVVDRSQLMALDVAHRFVTEHGEMWADVRDTTGVLGGVWGPTRSLVDCTIRASAGHLDTVPWDAAERAAYAEELAEVRARQRITKETLPGMAPCIGLYRVANRWDMRGPTMSFDAGAGSGLSTVHAALRYLRQGRMDLAMVLTINESATAIAAEFTHRDQARLAEGAFLLAFARAETARAHGWPVVAEVGSALAPVSQTGDEVTDSHDYLGATDIVTLLRRTVRGTRAEVESPSPGIRVTVTPAEPRTTRWVTAPRRADATPLHTATPAIPPRSVVLVSTPELAAELAEPVRAAEALLIPATLDETSTTELLAQVPGRQHVRVFADTHRPIEQWCQTDPGLDRLLELTLQVSQKCGDGLAEGSFAVTVLDPLTGFLLHPDAALFTGFARSLGWEIPPERVRALVTDAPLPRALEELAAETGSDRDAPLVYYRGGLRHVDTLCPAPIPQTTGTGLGPEPVVVAVGGARGLTANVLAGLARRSRPVLWLLGRSDPNAVPADVLAADDADRPRLRTAFIQRERESGAGVAEANRRFDHLWRSREAAATVRRLKELCGEDRVHYLQCDVSDAAAVTRAAETIGSRHERVDLVVNSAVVLASARYTGKSLAGFRRVIATKVTGYRNLKTAFAALLPGIWCNFGSTIVLSGLAGETDYNAGSEYLAAAARYEARLLGHTTVTVNWGMWEDSGGASDEETRKRMDAIGAAGGIGDAEGGLLFRAELAAAGKSDPAPIYTTEHDRLITAKRFPALLGDVRPPAGSALLGEPAEQTPDRASWTWSAQPGRDDYLLEHLINGRPSLPVMVLAAMAAEAAGRLCPGVPVRQLRDLTFTQYALADPRRPKAARYRVLAETVVPGEVVRVRLSSDVIAPGGQVLRTDRVHAVLDVVLGEPDPQPAPEVSPFDSGIRLLDPSCRLGWPAHLTGVFGNIVDISSDDTRTRARFQPRLSPGDAFNHAALPVLLLDALGRTCYFPVTPPGRVTMGVPTRIDSIDLYLRTTDRELAERYPLGIDLQGSATQNKYTATAPDGTVIARISGIRRHFLATLDLAPLP
ncbi:SDR family oxidoreductase [Amycolatopsis sp. NPDC088138]|uniref:SDR family oxidoreductase n=1 Tax=Amycolatopsis sp. NPDC088138 TaxID=3363938 RepID=UPI00380F66EC